MDVEEVVEEEEEGVEGEEEEMGEEEGEEDDNEEEAEEDDGESGSLDSTGGDAFDIIEYAENAGGEEEEDIVEGGGETWILVISLSPLVMFLMSCSGSNCTFRTKP